MTSNVFVAVLYDKWSWATAYEHGEEPPHYPVPAIIYETCILVEEGKLDYGEGTEQWMRGCAT